MSILTSLRAVSYLAPNWFGLYQAITAYLGRVLQLEIQLHLSECDPLQDPRAVSFDKSKKLVNIVRDKSLSNCDRSMTISTEYIECARSHHRQIRRSITHAYSRMIFIK
ncbi:MAG: hypothetical protein V7K92_05385, partial [Nostoc sp.]